MGYPKFVRDFAFNQGFSQIGEILRQDSALVKALEAFKADDPFMRVVEVYAANTANKDDDAVIANLEKESFRKLLGLLIGKIRIPDFDGNPDDDITVAEALDRIVEEVTK